MKKELPEKLDLIKVRKEMWEPITFDSERQGLINEVVAREINLLENKINEIIDYLKAKEEVKHE